MKHSNPTVRMVGFEGGPMSPVWMDASLPNPWGETWRADVASPDGGWTCSFGVVEGHDQFDVTLREFSSPASDRRLRCALWLNRARRLAGDFVASFGDDLGIKGEPVALVWSPGAAPRGERPDGARLLWRSETGGVDLFSARLGIECGDCLGCKSVHLAGDATSRVYFVQSVDGGPVKIGRSIDPTARLGTLQTAHPTTLRVLATMPGGPIAEKALHRMFECDRVRPDGEWFHASASLLAFIKEIAG